jgi:preprotein translocase subunit YajC
MSDAESIYTFSFGLVIFLIFWFLLNRAHAMRAKGRDLMASGQKDLASGRKKIQDGRKSVFTGTLLLIAVSPLVIAIILALVRACAVASN